MANDMQQSSLDDSEQIIDTPTKKPSSGANSSQQPPRPIIWAARGSHDVPPGYISVHDAGICFLRRLTASMAKNSANSSQQPPRPIIWAARGSHDVPPGYISVHDAGIRFLHCLTTASMAKNSANSSQQPPRPVIWVANDSRDVPPKGYISLHAAGIRLLSRLTTDSMAKNSSNEPSLEQPNLDVHQSEPQDSNNGQPSSPKVQTPRTYASIFKDTENIGKKGALCSRIPSTGIVGLDRQSGTGTHSFSTAPNIDPQNPYGILGGLNTDDVSIPAVPHEEGDPVDLEDVVEEVRDPTAQFMKS